MSVLTPQSSWRHPCQAKQRRQLSAGGGLNRTAPQSSASTPYPAHCIHNHQHEHANLKHWFTENGLCPYYSLLKHDGLLANQWKQTKKRKQKHGIKDILTLHITDNMKSSISNRKLQLHRFRTSHNGHYKPVSCVFLSKRHWSWSISFAVL